MTLDDFRALYPDLDDESEFRSTMLRSWFAQDDAWKDGEYTLLVTMKEHDFQHRYTKRMDRDLNWFFLYILERGWEAL